jgi:DNA-directed RNA polymerase subunit RPC12/RpoP
MSKITDLYKDCPKCGTLTRRGSGYFPTDYLCSKCGTEFNGAGQIFAPRKQWGEETGEHFE